MTHSPQDYKSQVLQSKNMRQQSPAVMMSDAVGVPALLITSSVLGTAETAGVSDSVCVDAVSARSDCAETCSWLMNNGAGEVEWLAALPVGDCATFIWPAEPMDAVAMEPELSKNVLQPNYLCHCNSGNQYLCQHSVPSNNRFSMILWSCTNILCWCMHYQYAFTVVNGQNVTCAFHKETVLRWGRQNDSHLRQVYSWCW